MQFIGHFLKYLVKKDETNDAVCLFHSFVVVPHLRRSGRNGQRYKCFHASWSRICRLPRERLLHLPSQQDRLIQEREMISNVSTNGYSLCMEVLFVLIVKCRTMGLSQRFSFHGGGRERAAHRYTAGEGEGDVPLRGDPSHRGRNDLACDQSSVSLQSVSGLPQCCECLRRGAQIAL